MSTANTVRFAGDTDHKIKLRTGPVSKEFLSQLASIDKEWNPKPWGEVLFSSEFHNRAARFRGAFLKSELAAYLLAHVVLDEAHIVSFGVQLKARRLGIGRFLLKESLERFSREGVRRITLEVRASNMAARALYESVGFTAAGIRKHYYSDNGEDALNLMCDLSGDRQ